MNSDTSTNQRGISTDAYVLHSLAYKETSLIVELFTRDAGRLPVIAKGAKRKHSALRPVLVSFQPIEVRLTGKLELRTLTHADWAGSVLAPDGKALFAAYYLNELLMLGLKREDPHPALFDEYANALARLSMGDDLNLTVRHFEIALLAELGFGLDFGCDRAGQAIDSSKSYVWVSSEGWHEADSVQEGSQPGSSGLAGGFRAIEGRLLIEVYESGLSAESALKLKSVTRQVLTEHIAPGGILSRTWMEQLLR